MPAAAPFARTGQSLAVEVGIPTTDAAQEAVPIDIPLTEALLELARIVRAATESSGLELREASVTLEFAVSKTGELTLLRSRARWRMSPPTR